MNKTHIVLFYSGENADSKNRTLKEILAWDDAELEDVHDYIQWLFPLRERSAFNSSAPLLIDEDVAAFGESASLRQNLLAAFIRMLSFYGFEMKRGDSEIAISPAPSFLTQKENWISEYNHNLLRITRILKCLTTLGLEREALAFYSCLKELSPADQSTIGDETYTYWDNVVIKPK